MTSISLRVLGHLWMLPNTIVSALYLMVFGLIGWVRWAGWTPYALVLAVQPGNWIWKRMDGKWAGWASGAFIVVRQDCLKSMSTIAHEQAHVTQQMVFGIFQPLLYLLIMGTIWVLMRSKSPYYDNPFEIDAREYAESYSSGKLSKKEMEFTLR